MFNVTSAGCLMLVFAGSVFALDTAPQVIRSPEFVPPPVHPSTTSFTREINPSMPYGVEVVALQYRSVSVMQLQPVEPIIDIAADNLASRQSEVDWEFRRQDRLARFMMMAASNASANADIEKPLRRVRGENTPDM